MTYSKILVPLDGSGAARRGPRTSAPDPAGEIIDLANTPPNSLIVMSTHGRSSIGRWVLGSVAKNRLALT